MKIAISTDGQYVSQHFGRCPEFTILEIKDGKLINRETISNPGHHPGYLPKYLSEYGVNRIVAGGMGMRARELFEQAKIDAVLGIEGKIDQVINKIIDGSLEGRESVCRPGSGKGYGIDKTECEHE